MRHTNPSRRTVLASIAATFTAMPALRLAAQSAPADSVLRVTKTPTCGCCGAWVDLARQSGFAVEVTNTEDYDGMKAAAGVPDHLMSCHTATIGGYVVEGHVPFAAIRHMLLSKPDITGISVPGMPATSPGMGGARDAVVPVTAWGGVAKDGAPFAFGS